MDALVDPLFPTVVVMSSAQVGKTEILNNMIGYCIDLDPGPVLVVQPTVDMAETWSKDRLAPMLRDTPALRGKIGDARSRDSNSTILHKSFPGGQIAIVGANSPSSLASRPIRYIFADEVDRYPESAGEEGDPLSLAIRRTATYWNRRVLMLSTPNVSGTSRIEKAYLESDQRKYFIPCQDCGHMQVMEWAQVEWYDDDPGTAKTRCVACGSIWDDDARWRSVSKGEWRPTAKGSSGIAGFHINAMYSPWAKLSGIVSEYLSAKRTPETLKTWVNTALGLPFTEDWLLTENYQQEAEDWPLDVPHEAYFVTCGVDVQANRLEALVMAWGDEEEAWYIDHQIFGGPTNERDVWERMWHWASGINYEVEGAPPMPISGMAVDAGYNTQSVYDFVSANKGRRVWATKGISGFGRPIIKAAAQRLRSRHKAAHEMIGVDDAKVWVYSRLHSKEQRWFHFPRKPWCDSEFFAQLTAEQLKTTKRNGFAGREWIKMRERNEVLDLTVLCLAAQRLLEPNWQMLKKRREAPAVDPDAQKKAEAARTAAPEWDARRRRMASRPKGSFVNSWRR